MKAESDGVVQCTKSRATRKQERLYTEKALADLEENGCTETACPECGKMAMITVPPDHTLRHRYKSLGILIELLDANEEVVLRRWGQNVYAAFFRFAQSINTAFGDDDHADGALDE